MATHKTGEDIDTQCTRCKMELAHVIIAMEGSKVLKVQCKTCGSLHVHRGSKASSKAVKAPKAAPKSTLSASSGSSRTTKTPSARSVASAARHAEASFDDAIQGLDISRAQPYKANETYGENVVIHHPSFGLRVISRLMADGKMQVLFREGGKILVHSR